MRNFLLLLAASACLSITCLAQDQSTSDQQPSTPAPSLGDIARQVRLKKQQKAQLQQAKASRPATDIQNADAKADAQPVKPAHIVTNDDSSEHASVTSAVEQATTSASSDPQPSHEDRNAKADKWKSDILAQKGQIASMEQEMKALSDSIHFAGANCVANCAEWNQKQQERQQQVESMKGQLQELQKQLENMQDSARKEGFGGTVSDPSE